MKKLLIPTLLFCSILAFTQETTGIDYTFPFYDGSNEYMTMRQMNRLYQSANTILTAQIYELYDKYIVFNRPVILFINLVTTEFLCEPLTHEEGHRSILTAQGIGAISQPIFDTAGAAYVKGVSDSTLQNLRDTDLPMFIRLHTAGIESDYMNMQQAFKTMAFNLSPVTNISLGEGPMPVVYTEYLIRMLNVWTYPFMSLIDDWRTKLGEASYTAGLVEEDNELDRDIVGEDVYGMVHHLFNPTSEYHRYWNYEDLSQEEREFAWRLGYRSCINLISPSIIGRENFQLTDSLRISGNMGYCLAPFGDFIDENFYLKFGKFNITAYARQAENRNNWFPAFGISLYQYKPVDWLTLSVGGHFWMQPENLDFNTATGVPGGAAEGEAQFVLPGATSAELKGIGLSLGALYKTYGFMPEIEQHDSHFRLSAGLVLRY